MFEKFNIKLVIYVIVALIVVAYGSYQVKEFYGGLGAVIYFAGSLYVCFIYGMRWFGSDKDELATWPPTINSCPDYLTLFPRKNADGTVEQTCVDTIGISKQGILKMFPKDGATNPPSDPTYYFSLTTTTANKNKEYCDRAIGMGLTWEGITNGESCMTSNGQPGSNPSAASCNK